MFGRRTSFTWFVPTAAPPDNAAIVPAHSATGSLPGRGRPPIMRRVRRSADASGRQLPRQVMGHSILATHRGVMEGVLLLMAYLCAKWLEGLGCGSRAVLCSQEGAALFVFVLHLAALYFLSSSVIVSLQYHFLYVVAGLSSLISFYLTPHTRWPLFSIFLGQGVSVLRSISALHGFKDMLDVFVTYHVCHL